VPRQQSPGCLQLGDLGIEGFDPLLGQRLGAGAVVGGIKRDQLGRQRRPVPDPLGL
jgi:hypothetical protein